MENTLSFIMVEIHPTQNLNLLVVVLNPGSPVDDFEFRSDQFLPVSTLHFSSATYPSRSCVALFSSDLMSTNCVVLFLCSPVKPALRCPCSSVPGVYFRAALQAAAGGDGVRHQNARASCHLLCHRESEHAGEASRSWLRNFDEHQSIETCCIHLTQAA